MHKKAHMCVYAYWYIFLFYFKTLLVFPCQNVTLRVKRLCLCCSLLYPSDQLSSVAQSCPTLCKPMDCSMPGFPVHPQLLELAQTHVHWVSDASQPSYLWFPFSSCPQSSPDLFLEPKFSIENVIFVQLVCELTELTNIWMEPGTLANWCLL